MYERFTDRARKVMQLANQEAQRFNHEYIGTEHVLLGLVKEGSGVAAHVIKELDVDLRKIRLEVEKLVQSGPEMVTMGKLPQTRETKKATETAMATSRELGHDYVGTEHLLLGLLQAKGVARDVLTNLKVSTERAKELTLELLGSGLSDQSDGGLLSNAAKKDIPWYDPRANVLRRSAALLEQAKSAWFAPLCGPWRLDELVSILNRSWRNSALLVGPRGVGKRTLVEKLACEIAAALVKGSTNTSIAKICGTEIEELTLDDSASHIAKRLKRGNHRTLFFIEDIASFLDQDVSEALLEFPVWLNAALARGARCIGTISLAEEDLFAEYPQIAAHFERLELSAPPRKQVLEIVSARAEGYVHNHQVQITGEAVQEAHALAECYGGELYPCHAQPATTLDVIEHAAAAKSWQRAKEASTATKVEVGELLVEDVVQSVAVRLNKDVDGVKNRD